MGKKDDKANLRRLEALMLAQIEKANAPDPYLQRMMQLNDSIVNWHTGSGVKDIYKHPTLPGKLPIHQTAMRNRDAARVGRGVRGLNAMSDVGYTKDLKLEDEFNRSMNAAGMLENSLTNELDGAQTRLGGLVDQDTSRRMSANSILGSYKNDLTGRINKPSGFMGFLKGAAKFALPLLGSALTGGFSSLGSLGGIASSGAGGMPVGHS